MDVAADWRSVGIADVGVGVLGSVRRWAAWVISSRRLRLCANKADWRF